jgi:hypothetical protein
VLFGSFEKSVVGRSGKLKSGSGDISDRVAERHGDIGKNKPTEANNFGSFTAKDGIGSESEMGWCAEGIEASSGSENNCVGICEAHDVSVSPQEDRRRTESEMGEVEGGAEESGVRYGSLPRVCGRLSCFRSIRAPKDSASGRVEGNTGGCDGSVRPV